MSYSTWHNYGYGLRTDNLVIKSVESLEELIGHAPEYQAWVKKHFEELQVDKPKIADYLELDEDFNNGLASIMCAVIREAEGLELTACDDFDCCQYLLYQPLYPWQMKSEDRKITEERLDEIFKRYFPIITEDEISLDYLSPENGG